MLISSVDLCRRDVALHRLVHGVDGRKNRALQSCESGRAQQVGNMIQYSTTQYITSHHCASYRAYPEGSNPLCKRYTGMPTCLVHPYSTQSKPYEERSRCWLGGYALHSSIGNRLPGTSTSSFVRVAVKLGQIPTCTAVCT